MFLCPNNDPSYEAKQECFDRYPLKLSGSREHRFYIPSETKKKGVFRYRVRLPPYVTCTQCVLQWTYYTGNMWGRCSNGTEAVGCGKPGSWIALSIYIYISSFKLYIKIMFPETFRNCADIAITSNTGGLPPIFVNPPSSKNPFLLYYRDFRAPMNEDVFPLVVR